MLAVGVVVGRAAFPLVTAMGMRAREISTYQLSLVASVFATGLA
jgi:hypothetical protein